MPERLSSRTMLHSGVGLVLLSGLLIVGPVLWGRPNLARQLVEQNTELDSITNTVNDIHNAVDSLREAFGAERDYLLTGESRSREAFEGLEGTARSAIIKLRDNPDLALSARLDTLVNQQLADLVEAVALQDAGRHDDAVAASHIGVRYQIAAEIDSISQSRISVEQARNRDIVDQIRAITERSEQFAGISFTLAGACFVFGCIALVGYQSRHLANEAALRIARDAALQASVVRARFIATASHDLRQPLHAISMFVGVLRRLSHDATVLDVVENIRIAVASMQRMFAALLDQARLDAGAIKIERRSVALQEMFAALAVEFAGTAAERGLSLQIQPTSCCVMTDPAMLEIILRNLIGNAVKFTDRGWVGVISRHRGAVVDIIVFDTGIGIAAEDQEAIFSQFARVTQAGGAREGLGLGLSIVRRIADLLEVPLALDSQHGHGSRFTLSLPAAAPPEGDEPSVPVPVPSLKGYCILVLDDHASARRAVALAIETMGAKALEVDSSSEALRLLAAMAPHMPDAAVVDHDIGGGQTGPEFLDAYAAQHDKAMPALILTGSTDTPTLALLAAGGRPWLIKPVDLDALSFALAALVDSGSGAGRPS